MVIGFYCLIALIGAATAEIQNYVYYDSDCPAASNCQVCLVGDPSFNPVSCLVCEVGYFRVTSGTSYSCTECDDDFCDVCSSVDAMSCTQCSVGYAFASDGTCTATPQCTMSSQYVTTAPTRTTAIACDSTCVQANCLECGSFAPSMCTKCNAGYFVNYDGSCIATGMTTTTGCTVTQCSSCPSAVLSKCVACNGGYFLALDATCSSSAVSCPAGSVVSPGSAASSATVLPSCTSCFDSNCDVCSGSAESQCTQCAVNFFLTIDGSCSFTPPTCTDTSFNGVGLYVTTAATISTTVVCAECDDANCLGCSGSGLNQCFQCSLGSTLQDDGTCMQTCDPSCRHLSWTTSNTFGFEAVNGNGGCCQCETSTCSGTPITAQACTQCYDGYYFADTQTCLPCEDNGCKACSGSGTGKCEECFQGLYLAPTGTCTSCTDVHDIQAYLANGLQVCQTDLCRVTQCQTCKPNNAYKCQTCNDGYVIYGDKCALCADSNCATCDSLGVGECSVCNEGFVLAANNTCTPTPCDPSCPTDCCTCVKNQCCSSDGCDAASTCTVCNAGYYPNESGVCETCEDSDCLQCSGAGSEMCIACALGFYQDSGSCTPCDDSDCFACSGAGTEQCYGCNDGYQLTYAGTCTPTCDRGCPAFGSCVYTNVCICDDGYFQIERRCQAWAPPCDTSMFYEAFAPTAYNDRLCKVLTQCRPWQWETSAPTYSSDRVCTDLTKCEPGVSFQDTAPTATSDRHCTSFSTCDPEYYIANPKTRTSDVLCLPWSTCTGTQFESFAPNKVADRECTDLTVCDDTSQYEKKPPTPTSNRICADFRVCQSYEFEAQAPTTTTDRVCYTTTVCKARQFEAVPPTPTTDRICQDVTVCRLAEYEAAANTATTDRVCLPKPKYTITGKVVDDDGDPIPDAKVAVSTTNYAYSDATGSYTITNVRPGKVLIAVFKPSVISLYQHLEVTGDTTVNFTRGDQFPDVDTYKHSKDRD